MGEQSNTWWILLHNDRKSRHRRIKKQRRYGRLAATSQFLDTEEFDAGISSRTNLTATRATVITLLSVTISGGSSMYLRPRKTHTLPCVEPLSARKLYPSRLLITQSLELFPVLLQVLHDEVLPSSLGVQGSKGFPASRCVASKFLMFVLYHYSWGITVSHTDNWHCLTWRWGGLIARDW